MPTGDDLCGILSRIDGRGYRAYREIRADFEVRDFKLFIDHVQGDPYAAPSKLRWRVLQTEAALPASLFDTAVRRIALEDALARRVRDAIHGRGGSRRDRDSSGRNAPIAVDAGGQQVLQRTAVAVTADWVEVRLEVDLPAAGRRIRADRAKRLLCEELPEIVEEALVRPPLDALRGFVECVENQEHLRGQLGPRGLIAFVGDGSLLPRESGASDRPLTGEAAVRFRAPAALRVELELLHPIDVNGRARHSMAGLGVPAGVTLIVGGGYHGKSTLLHAIQQGVYPHIPGDGREWVVADRNLVKVRAEDGRRVEKVDIDAFISNLPQRRSTTAFDSDDASGSTSQAANIAEAIEAGASGLLLDEDTSATNFMVRDARMQALIHRDFEPITPFVERVRELYDVLSVSTVLVMGGCGDYFDVADRVIALRDFQPLDVTEQAREIAAASDSTRQSEARSALRGFAPRIPLADSFDPSRGRKELAIGARGVDRIDFGRSEIDLRGVEQLVDASQTRAIASAIQLAATRWMDGRRPLGAVLDELERLLDERGLDELDPFHRPGRHPGNYARPRRFEIAAAINRLRTLRIEPVRDPA